MRRNLRAVLTTSAALILIPALPAMAQDAAEEPTLLNEITLSANQTTAEVSRTGATVEVADARQIERAGNARAADFLTTLPGIAAFGNGGFGTATSLRLRGLGDSYIKVLYDGIDISDPSNPQITLNWGSILTGGLSRIEVLKGPQSALYGSEAIAGVVSLYSAPSDAPGFHQSAQLEYGSYATLNSRYAIAHNTDRANLSFSVQHFETNGFSVADENDGNTEADGARSTLVNLHGAVRVTDQVTVGAAFFWQDSDVQTDGSFPILADNADSSHAIRRGGRVYAQYDGDLTNHELSLQRSSTSREEVFGGFAYPYDGDRREITYTGSADVTPQSVVSWGASHSEETYQSSGSVAEGYITNSIFTEYRQALNPDTDLSLSARHDNVSEFGSKSTYRAALAWRVAEGWTLRAQAGTGIRAPSPYELHDVWSGNPDLVPETSKGYEIGVERDWINGANLRVSAFRNDIDKLIEYSNTTFKYQQTTGSSRVQGVEIAAEAPLTDRLTLTGNFTYTDSEGPDGRALDRVPRRMLNLRLDGEVTDRTNFGVTLQHMSGFNDGGAEMPTFTTVGALIEHQITDTTTGYIRVENLLDEQYQVIRGYGTSDRAVYVGVRASF